MLVQGHYRLETNEQDACHRKGAVLNQLNYGMASCIFFSSLMWCFSVGLELRFFLWMKIFEFFSCAGLSILLTGEKKTEKDLSFLTTRKERD